MARLGSGGDMGFLYGILTRDFVKQAKNNRDDSLLREHYRRGIFPYLTTSGSVVF